jgi:hypothetical protein
MPLIPSSAPLPPASQSLSPADFTLLLQSESVSAPSLSPDSSNFSSAPLLNSSHAALRQALSHLIEDSKRSSSFIEQQNLREWKEEKESSSAL